MLEKGNSLTWNCLKLSRSVIPRASWKTSVAHLCCANWESISHHISVWICLPHSCAFWFWGCQELTRLGLLLLDPVVFLLSFLREVNSYALPAWLEMLVVIFTLGMMTMPPKPPLASCSALWWTPRDGSWNLILQSHPFLSLLLLCFALFLTHTRAHSVSPYTPLSVFLSFLAASCYIVLSWWLGWLPV